MSRTSCYWQGTQDEFFKLYDYSVDAVLRALPEARVGGPDSTGPANPKATEYLRGFLDHCAHQRNYVSQKIGSRLDFILFHPKGSPKWQDGHVVMGLARQLASIQQGFKIVRSFPEWRDTPIILGESDPEGCAACSARTNPQNGYRNGPLYAAYGAESLAATYALAAQEQVNIIGAVSWSFEFEDQPYFEGFRELATNGLDKPVLNAFRMFGLLGDEHVKVSNAHARPIDQIAAAGVQRQPDIHAIATRHGSEIGCAFNENGTSQGGVGDYDCDGWLDIVKTNYSDQTANLYHNNGDGTFYDAVFHADLGVNTKYLGWGVGLFDFDNDGWPDIFMSDGHVFSEVDTRRLHVTFKQRKILYRNLGQGRFIDVRSASGPALMQPHSSRGTAFGDFDNDGDIDVAIINMNEPPSLLRNDSRSKNNWLKIKCIGTKSNRSAIGARVRVVTAKHSQMNEVMSGSSLMSQNDLRLHFGLGQAKQADLIEVRWPLGLVESFKNIQANQLLILQEGQGILHQEKLGKR